MICLLLVLDFGAQVLDPRNLFGMRESITHSITADGGKMLRNILGIETNPKVVWNCATWRLIAQHTIQHQVTQLLAYELNSISGIDHFDDFEYWHASRCARPRYSCSNSLAWRFAE